MDISSLYRTSAREKKATLKVMMAAYTVRKNNKRANKLRAYTFKPRSMKEQIAANKKLRQYILREKLHQCRFAWTQLVSSIRRGSDGFGCHVEP